MTDHPKSLGQRAGEYLYGLTERIKCVFGTPLSEERDRLTALLADVQREERAWWTALLANCVLPEEMQAKIAARADASAPTPEQEKMSAYLATLHGTTPAPFAPYANYFKNAVCFTCEGESGLPPSRTVDICETCYGEEVPVADAPATPPAPRMGENTTDISSKLNSTILLGRETIILICPVCKRQAEAGEYVGITGCSKCNPWKFFNSAPPAGKYRK